MEEPLFQIQTVLTGEDYTAYNRMNLKRPFHRVIVLSGLLLLAVGLVVGVVQGFRIGWIAVLPIFLVIVFFLLMLAAMRHSLLSGHVADNPRLRSPLRLSFYPEQYFEVVGTKQGFISYSSLKKVEMYGDRLFLHRSGMQMTTVPARAFAPGDWERFVAFAQQICAVYRVPFADIK